MNEQKFNSQICTTVEQSKRLLELGLKAETADMVLFKTYDLPQYPFDYTFNQDPSSLNKIRYVPTIKEEQPFVQDGNIPAWSLHRLIELYTYKNEALLYYMIRIPNSFDGVINDIAKRIENKHFNKEYLK